MGQIKNIKLHIVTDIKVNISQDTYLTSALDLTSLKHKNTSMDQITAAIVPAGVCQRFPSSGEAVHQTGSQRIPEDCHGNRDWIFHHGVHWVLCETHSYPDK